MTTLMRQEIDETPDAVRRFLERSTPAVEAAGAALRDLRPPVIATVARGSSDHAATYFKYAVEIVCGVPVASLGPSVASIYGAQPRLAGAAAVAVSQSGRSPDIVAMFESAAAGGAETIAIVNDPASPLAGASRHVLPLEAGPERSVAATKSYVTSVVAGLALLAAWRQDVELRDALLHLPIVLEAALAADWTAVAERVKDAPSLYTLGRGPGFAIASEAALKFKETAALHAEAYSGAEIIHGPVAIVGRGFPVFAFLPDDAARPSLVAVAERIAAEGGALYVAGEGAPGIRLPTLRTGHPLTEALPMIVSFYGFVEALARARGLDPDRPHGLKKVTETV